MTPQKGDIWEYIPSGCKYLFLEIVEEFKDETNFNILCLNTGEYTDGWYVGSVDPSWRFVA
jgi:hypothetical protein